MYGGPEFSSPQLCACLHSKQQKTRSRRGVMAIISGTTRVHIAARVELLHRGHATYIMHDLRQEICQTPSKAATLCCVHSIEVNILELNVFVVNPPEVSSCCGFTSSRLLCSVRPSGCASLKHAVQRRAVLVTGAGDAALYKRPIEVGRAETRT